MTQNGNNSRTVHFHEKRSIPVDSALFVTSRKNIKYYKKKRKVQKIVTQKTEFRQSLIKDIFFRPKSLIKDDSKWE